MAHAGYLRLKKHSEWLNFIDFSLTQLLHEHVIRKLSVLISPKWRVFTAWYVFQVIPFLDQAVSRYTVISEGRTPPHVSLSGICGEQSDTDRGYSPYITVFPCQYHSTIASYSFIHLPPTLYNVFLPTLQFSPVSIIPPLHHTLSPIYHLRCIMFFSQHFSFPLSESFHHCSILIHPSTTHTV